jgi:hypothetical protein
MRGNMGVQAPPFSTAGNRDLRRRKKNTHAHASFCFLFAKKNPPPQTKTKKKKKKNKKKKEKGKKKKTIRKSRKSGQNASRTAAVVMAPLRLRVHHGDVMRRAHE